MLNTDQIEYGSQDATPNLYDKMNGEWLEIVKH